MTTTAKVAALILLSAISLYAVESVTLEGKLVSSTCYLGPNHQSGNDMGNRKGCGSYCLRHGDPAGLLSNNNDFHILVMSSITLAPYVGQQVRVTGTDHIGAIAVDKVEVMKDGKWSEISRKSRS